MMFVFSLYAYKQSLHSRYFTTYKIHLPFLPQGVLIPLIYWSSRGAFRNFVAQK